MSELSRGKVIPWHKGKNTLHTRGGGKYAYISAEITFSQEKLLFCFGSSFDGFFVVSVIAEERKAGNYTEEH